MIVKIKPSFFCSSCGDEINKVSYEREYHLVGKYEHSLGIKFSPNKCPHCGEIIEAMEYNINDFKFLND